jgi:hypothetical protein
MANSRRRPSKKRREFAYGTPPYFEEQDKQLGAQLRALRLAAKRGSKKAARRVRETERQITAVRERADFAKRVQQQIRAGGELEGYRAERRRQRFFVRSFSRLPTAERRKISVLLATYGSRPVPGNVDAGLSNQAWWLFFRSGGQTG